MKNEADYAAAKIASFARIAKERIEKLQQASSELSDLMRDIEIIRRNANRIRCLQGSEPEEEDINALAAQSLDNPYDTTVPHDPPPDRSKCDINDRLRWLETSVHNLTTALAEHINAKKNRT